MYKTVNLKNMHVNLSAICERVVCYHTVFMFFLVDEEHRQTASPWSPTAARSPSSLWLRPSVSPPAGVWLLSLHQYLSASGSTSHLSTIW